MDAAGRLFPVHGRGRLCLDVRDALASEGAEVMFWRKKEPPCPNQVFAFDERGRLVSALPGGLAVGGAVVRRPDGGLELAGPLVLVKPPPRTEPSSGDGSGSSGKSSGGSQSGGAEALCFGWAAVAGSGGKLSGAPASADAATPHDPAVAEAGELSLPRQPRDASDEDSGDDDDDDDDDDGGGGGGEGNSAAPAPEPAPELTSEAFDPVVVYPWTGANQLVMHATDDHVALGGGGGAFGLFLDDDFMGGATGACETFDNAPLCSQEQFECATVELWGFAAV